MTPEVIEFQGREVVLVEDIAPMVQEWIDRQEARLKREGHVGWDDVCGPQERLAFESGIPLRRLYGILHGESEAMNLTQADELLFAIDRHISEVEVYCASEARKAAYEQAAILRNIARATGVFIPTGREARTALPYIKRRLRAAA